MADQTQPLTLAQIQELAQEFHDLAAAIGAYRLAQANKLTDDQQYQLQNQQLLCIQYSNTFITAGLKAQQSDLVETLATIKQQTDAAKQAIATINNIDNVLQIVTAAAVLGASIASSNPAAIANGIQGLITAIAAPTTSADSATTTTQSTG
jgi:hypothetical protein